MHVATGKVTPKYKGYFVSFWKKVNNVNTPYSINEVNTIIVSTVDGYIILNQQYLLDKKILKTSSNKGKLGFRIKEDDSSLILLSKQEVLSRYPNCVNLI